MTMLEPLIASWTEENNIVECNVCKTGQRRFIGKACSVCERLALQIALQEIEKGMTYAIQNNDTTKADSIRAKVEVGANHSSCIS